MRRLRPAQMASQAAPMFMHYPQMTGGRPKMPATSQRRKSWNGGSRVGEIGSHPSARKQEPPMTDPVTEITPEFQRWVGGGSHGRAITLHRAMP